MALEQSLQLPLQITGPVDVGRLLRELDAIDATLTQAAIRHDGSESKLPKTTQLMDQLLELNKVSLADAAERKRLTTFLQHVKAKAPVLHISFSADPSTAFTERLMSWLRKELHPQMLLTVGLQPNIGAGCIVRSTNKYFDFSLRQDFAGKRAMLLEKIDPLLAVPTNITVAGIPTPITTQSTVAQAVQTAEAVRPPAPAAPLVHAAPAEKAQVAA